MKILIHSDTHLGYSETNQILAPDSFLSFAEILYRSNQHNVDLILNGGDLFNVNNPSRFTINQTLKILKQFILTTPDKQVNKKLNTNIPLVFEDMKVNIKIPYLSINGNHDDPAGLHRISPMNLLHSTGIIHYFGQTKSIDYIEVIPIIFKDYSIAIYGIGYIRDEKFLKNLINKQIIFKDLNEFNFNILIIHQNRIPIGRIAINENLFDDKFDVIIYGHEHEPQNFRNNKDQLIIQCGSSVRTSLSQSETTNKYYYILDIPIDHKKDEKKIYNFEVYELETLRKFFYSSLDLINIKEEDKVIDKINEEFNKLINKKYKYNIELFNKLNELINYREEFKVNKEFLPLIRVKVISNMPISRTKFLHYEIKCANKNIIKCIREKKKDKKIINNKEKEKIYSKFGNEFYDKMYEYMNNKQLNIIYPQKFINELERNKLEIQYKNTMKEYLKYDVYDLEIIKNVRKKLENEFIGDDYRKNKEISIIDINKELETNDDIFFSDDEENLLDL